MSKKPRHIEDTTFVAGQFKGRSKSAREGRAQLIGTLAAQENLFVIGGAGKGEDGKSSVYAVIFGDDDQDGERAWGWCNLLNNVPALVKENEDLRASLAQLKVLMDKGGTITVNLDEAAPSPPSVPKENE